MFILAITIFMVTNHLLAETDHSSASTSKDSECLEADQSEPMTSQPNKYVETGKWLDKTWIYKEKYN